MLRNKKFMAFQKTLLIPPQKVSLFHFYLGSKTLKKMAFKLKNLEIKFFGD